jgi:hypothetical protein
MGTEHVELDDMMRAFSRDSLHRQGKSRTQTPLGKYYLTPEESQELMPLEDDGVICTDILGVGELEECDVCGEPFVKKAWNSKRCGPKCVRKYKSDFQLRRYHEQGLKDYQKGLRTNVRKGIEITELDKANLTDVLIRVTITEMLQMYRTETRWKKLFAEKFLMEYGKQYMEAVGQRVDFDKLLNMIDRELGQEVPDYGF